MRRQIILAIAVMLVSLTAVAVPSQQFTSSSERVTLIELFTSEGCSSCPKADRWISGLLDNEDLWQTFIPVAFHVDYWDYIGWKDRFARKAFSNRQALYRSVGRIRSVYTPGFVIAGKEWRGWFRLPQLNIADRALVGPLGLHTDRTLFKATFAPTVAIDAELELHVAILGFGLKTQVGAGENQGRELAHDFVVLGHRRYAMSAPQSTASAHRIHSAGKLPDAIDEGTRHGLVAWVSSVGDPLPIQAVGGWLD